MKAINYSMMLAGMLLLMGCNKPQTIHVADRQPIMPIHHQGDTTHLYLTDYVPQWTWEGAISMKADHDYQVEMVTPGEAKLWGGQRMGILTLQNGTDTVAIPILPELPVRQELITIKGAPGEVVITTLNRKPLKQIIVLIQNRVLSPNHILMMEDRSFHILLPENGLPGRSYMRVYALGDQFRYNDLLIPLEDGHPVTKTKELNRHDDQSQVLYSILIDRFQNGDTCNDWKMQSPEVLDIVDYQGGDLKGIAQKIEEGFFDTLGVNTLWISPITQNPWDAWGKYPFKNGNKYDSTKTYTKFSGYHGYWPIFTTVVDKRMGSNEDLKDLLRIAHEHEINVVLDYVANHLHIDAPVYKAHPDWHTDSILPNGKRNFELWDEARLTTWFDVHIPTLDLEREEVYQAMTDSALFWLENFELDGFRHDACKHIPECYWRTLTHKASMRFPNRHIWMIGETYGSPELINTYVKTGMLNAQFDFNIYFSATRALAGDGKLSDINQTILTSLATYGAHHTMGNVSGNHDQARYASLAGGAVSFDEDAKEAGWTREIGIGDAKKAYRTALLLEMLNLTIPGVPCIYQGDEYAEVGGNDPDNRHMIRFDNLSQEEQTFREQVKKLIHIRRNNMALMYGEYIPVQADDNTLIFDRCYMGETIRVKISTKETCSIMKNNKILFQL